MPERAFECLHVGRFTVDGSWVAERHGHPFVEVMAVFAGGLEVTFDDAALTARAGDVLVYAPGSMHWEKALPGEATDFVYFTVRNCPDGCPARLTHDRDHRVRMLAQWLWEEYSQGHRRREQSVATLAAAIVAETHRLGQVQPRTPLEDIRAYLREHMENAHTVEDLAKRARMGKFHFIRAYKRATGRTPMADLRQLRVDAACDLLLTTSLPLKAIARRAGFCDEYYFSRVFRRLRGMPPSAFRRGE
jgi:AraC-like DNA-binding protein